jgi:hypothetical protein
MTDPRYLRPGDLPFALAHAAEEAGELLAAIGKTLRWGADSVNPLLPPDQQETNREWILREIPDLQGALDRLIVELGASPGDNAA